MSCFQTNIIQYTEKQGGAEGGDALTRDKAIGRTRLTYDPAVGIMGWKILYYYYYYVKCFGRKRRTTCMTRMGILAEGQKL